MGTQALGHIGAQLIKGSCERFLRAFPNTVVQLVTDPRPSAADERGPSAPPPRTDLAEGAVPKQLDAVHFIDLTVELGCEYFYVHQCDCRHSVVFSNVR